MASMDRPSGRDGAGGSSVGFELARHLEAPLDWLASAPCSYREAFLLLNTASRARSFEKSFEVYVQLARRKKKVEGAWRSVATGKDLEMNAAFPFLSDILRASREARLRVLEDLSETIDALVQYSEELSKFSDVNKAFSERLKRKSRAATDDALRRALEEEFSGRHVLAECEREIAKRIKDITAMSTGSGSPGEDLSSLPSLSDFIAGLEGRLSGGAGRAGMDLAPAAQLQPDQPLLGSAPTLTIRGGIAGGAATPATSAAKRQRVSETQTPTQNDPDVLPSASGRTQRHSPRLTDAVKDLEIDASLQFASHSSDDSRKTPTLTPNQTAMPARNLVSKQGRSPWATPGVRRASGVPDKDSPPTDDSQTQSAGHEKKQKKAGGGGGGGEQAVPGDQQIGCALNFDDMPLKETQNQPKVNPTQINSSLSEDSQNPKNLSLGVTPSPPLTAST